MNADNSAVVRAERGDGKALVSGMKSRNRLYVLLLGTVIAMLAWAWQFETPPPDLMETLAASAGLRPAAHKRLQKRRYSSLSSGM